jgi:hypothetical protein
MSLMAGGRPPRPWRPRREALYLLLVLLAFIAIIAGEMWTVQRSLQFVAGERARLEALEDSLRPAVLLMERVRELELRLEQAESGLARSTDAARLPELIALRKWSSRLDSQIEVNRRRIAKNADDLDSLLSARAPEESAPPEPVSSESQGRDPPRRP